MNLQHHPVTGDLGNDAGGGDGKALGVAFDDGGLLHAHERDAQSVHQHVIGMNVKTVQSELHGAPGRAQDVVAVDDVDIGNADGPVELGSGR